MPFHTNKFFNVARPSSVSDTMIWGGWKFEFWPLPKILDGRAGVYLLARSISNVGQPLSNMNEQYPVYVGESNNAGRRLRQHKSGDSTVLRRSTHIHFLAIEEEGLRQRIERELIAHENPPLNEKHRTGPADWRITAAGAPDLYSRSSVASNFVNRLMSHSG